MSIYITPIYAALIFFLFLSILLTLPFVIYNYHKFGSILFSRVFVLFSFMFYLITAFFLTMLPLPDIEEIRHMKAPSPQLIPFKFVTEFIQRTTLVINMPSTYIPALTQNIVIQPAFNLFLLLPLGVYLRYYFHFSFMKTLLVAFITSLFFELTQLTGIYGIYPHAYRLFDVDDLLLNTLGSIIGFSTASLFTFFLPSREKMKEISLKRSLRVSFIRRFVAYIIDWFILSSFTEIILQFGILPFTSDSIKGNDHYIKLTLNALIIFLYFIILPSFTKGYTIGKKIVHIKIKREDGTEVRFKHLLLRYSLLYCVVGGLIFFPNSIPIKKVMSEQAALMLSIISGIVVCLFTFHVLINFFSKDKRLFYEKMSRTIEVSSYEEKKLD